MHIVWPPRDGDDPEVLGTGPSSTVGLVVSPQVLARSHIGTGSTGKRGNVHCPYADLYRKLEKENTEFLQQGKH